MKVEMVDLKNQYFRIKKEIDEAVTKCFESTKFINGPAVSSFEIDLASYNEAKYVIGCANGTDALQIALMACELKPGDEVIVPAFTYISAAEVIKLLGLKPVVADVSRDTFNIDINSIKKVYSRKSKAIIPVHLFGQSADMEPILAFARDNNLFVIEDNAQSIGSNYTFSDGKTKKTGTLGQIGTTSFFPSKNLGCYGDGGALITNNDELAEKIRMICNHGQTKKNFHAIVGVNSRLDTVQAEILKIKLKYLETYIAARLKAATYYDEKLKNVSGIIIPHRHSNSTHVFNQYTVQVKNGRRNDLKAYLLEKGIPSMIYYPYPINKQQAYYDSSVTLEPFPVANQLCEKVLSLPIHTEMNEEILNYISSTILKFFNG